MNVFLMSDACAALIHQACKETSSKRYEQALASDNSTWAEAMREEASVLQSIAETFNKKGQDEQPRNQN